MNYGCMCDPLKPESNDTCHIAHALDQGFADYGRKFTPAESSFTTLP